MMLEIEIDFLKYLTFKTLLNFFLEKETLLVAEEEKQKFQCGKNDGKKYIGIKAKNAGK